jgi:hypothetical protein
MIALLFLLSFISHISPLHSFSAINTTACGLTKSCWQQPNVCSANNCQTLIALQVNGSLLVIEMTAQTTGGNNPNINMAFSSDQKMGNDYTMTCVYIGGAVSVRSGCTPNGKSHLFSSNPQTGLSNIDGTFDSASQRLSCRFSHVAGLVNVPGNSAVKDLTPGNSYYLLFSISSDVTATSIVYHGSSYWWSPTQFTIGAISLASSNSGSASALTQAHGALMVAAWGGLIPLAITVVRHMRLTLPFTKLICGYKNWLQIHRILQGISTLLHCVAFALIFIAVGSLEIDLSDPVGASHPILGLILTALLLLNVVLGVVQTFVDKSSKRSQTVLLWTHLVVGSLAEIIAVPTLLLGMALMSSSLTWSFWVLLALLVLLLVVEVAFYVNSIVRNILRGRAMKARESGRDAEMPPPLIRSRFHQILFFVTAALCIGLVVAVIVGIAIGGN